MKTSQPRDGASLRFGFRGMLLVIIIVGANLFNLMFVGRYYGMVRWLERFGRLKAPSNVIALGPSPLQAKSALLNMFQKSALLNMFQKGPEGLHRLISAGADWDLPVSDAAAIETLIERRRAAFANSDIHSRVGYLYAGDVFQIDGWRCDGGRREFYKIVTVERDRRYKVVGRFTQGTAGNWGAELTRVLRVVTSDERPGGQDRGRTAYGGLEAVPTLAEARTALLRWLHNPHPGQELRLHARGLAVFRRMVSVLQSSESRADLAAAAAEPTADGFVVDGWVISPEDLRFAVAVTPLGLDYWPVIFQGRFQLASGGEWESVPCSLTEVADYGMQR